MTLASVRKAIAPAVLGVVTSITAWIATGEFDELEVRSAVAGLVMAVVVYFVPNDPSPTTL